MACSCKIAGVSKSLRVETAVHQDILCRGIGSLDQFTVGAETQGLFSQLDLSQSPLQSAQAPRLFRFASAKATNTTTRNSTGMM